MSSVYDEPSAEDKEIYDRFLTALVSGRDEEAKGIYALHSYAIERCNNWLKRKSFKPLVMQPSAKARRDEILREKARKLKELQHLEAERMRHRRSVMGRWKQRDHEQAWCGWVQDDDPPKSLTKTQPVVIQVTQETDMDQYVRKDEMNSFVQKVLSEARAIVRTERRADVVDDFTYDMTRACRALEAASLVGIGFAAAYFLFWTVEHFYGH